MPPKEEVGEEVKQFQVPFSGSWKPVAPGCAMGEGDFTVLTNMRYTEAPGIKAIFGMSKFGTHIVGFPQIPSMGYTTQQMTTSGTQTLTVTGGTAPYTWTIISGGGSLSSSTGSSITYTAPSSNANCSNNPTIQVCEFYGGCTTLKIAVNGDGATTNAYSIVSHTQASCGAHTKCCWAIYRTNYNCDGTITVGSTIGCDSCDCGDNTTDCHCGGGFFCLLSSLQARCNNCGSTGCADGNYDIRTSGMKTAGCCPAALL
jgi:hypothetical protein